MHRVIARPPVGIRFGDYVFSEPAPLLRYSSSSRSGLFVILVPDPTWRPRPFQPVFFGEFGAPNQRPITQEEYFSWFRASAGKEVYVATSEAPPGDLSLARRELIAVYRPLCNREAPDAGFGDDLTRKLYALERRDSEHDVMLRMMLAAMSRMLEPPEEQRKKRPIGFQGNLPEPTGRYALS